MCEISIPKKPSIELADLFLIHAYQYIEQHGVSVVQNKAIKAISQCRTAALGGHVARCNHCGRENISYNSCRYRYCPKCQTTHQLRWLENRKAELLPVEYFHVVFTIPHELNALASYNASVIYNLLFQSAWATIRTLGQDKKRLNGQMGMLSFLHTWGQNLGQHIHLHCLVPGGALQTNTKQKKIWHPVKSSYLFSVKVMSSLFGKYFREGIKKAYQNKVFTFKNAIAQYAKPNQFSALMSLLTKKNWNVYAKAPFNGAEGGLEYLARYVSKTAISNHRLVSCENGKVTFKWRDYSDGNKQKLMTLEAHEFIRRYLSHILPDGFMRVRSFGFLSNACKSKNIDLIRALIHPHQTRILAIKVKESSVELIKRLTGINVELCKHCKIGHLQKIISLPSKPPCHTYWNTS